MGGWIDEATALWLIQEYGTEEEKVRARQEFMRDQELRKLEKIIMEITSYTLTGKKTL